MTRPGYNNDRPFLGAIPFITLSNNCGGINLTYVPKFDDEMYPFWYLQFAFKLAEM